MRLVLALLLVVYASNGCARMVVKKNPGPHDNGIRFYRPKPYLFIGPAAAEPTGAKSPARGGENNDKGGAGSSTASGLAQDASAPGAGDNAEGEPNADEKLDILIARFQELRTRIDTLTNAVNSLPNEIDAQLPNTALQPITIRLEYLPDYSEEYSIRVTPGLGQATLNVQLQNGWNLVAANAVTDQKYAEILASLAQFANLAKGAAGVGGRGDEAPGRAESNVPMGYYEAVIATNECGRKEMLGWRYVGFMPCYARPVNARVYRDEAVGDDDHVYALVVRGGILQMKRMDTIKCGHDGLECVDCPPGEAATSQ